MRILASVFDQDGKEASRVWLNGASEKEDPLCCLEDCERTLGWSYPYCSVHLKDLFGVAIRRSKIHGMGLFAARDFVKGEKVVPYGGELVKTQRQLNERYSACGSADCTAAYAVHVKGKGYVDALRLRHPWVFANYGENANALLTNDGIKTKRKIRLGAEILVDYGEEFKFAGDVCYSIMT